MEKEWLRVTSTVMEFAEEVAPGLVASVKYESLFKDPEDTLNFVFDTLQLGASLLSEERPRAVLLPSADSTVGPAPIPTFDTTTKQLARSFGYQCPFDLPTNCCWLQAPTDFSVAATWCFVPGITGGAAATFHDLTPLLDVGQGGAIGIDVTSQILARCNTWDDLVRVYASTFVQIQSGRSVRRRAPRPLG